MEKCNVENVANKMFHLVKEDYKIISYGTSLYELYEELSFDPLLSLVGLLKSTGKITLGPEELSKQAFSQIYLVFDYEPHYQKYSDEKVKKMLSFFDNETETITVLKGTNPQTFDKFIEDKINEMEYEKFLSSYRYLSQSDFEPF